MVAVKKSVPIIASAGTRIHVMVLGRLFAAVKRSVQNSASAGTGLPVRVHAHNTFVAHIA